jgi:hypothetical protein
MSHKGQISTIILGIKCQNTDSVQDAHSAEKSEGTDCLFFILYCFVYYQFNSDENGPHLSTKYRS